MLTGRISPILLLGIASLFALGCKKEPTKEEMLSGLSAEDRRALGTMTNTPFIVDGTNAPEFTSAGASRLKDDEEVIGIVVQGSARAYPLARLSGMIEHVVNDSLSGGDGKIIPFSVTYCDMTDCARVFESASGEAVESLELGTLGLLDGGLALRWKDKTFKQMEERIEGLKDMPFQRTSWREWKAQYPDTLIYAGRTAPSR
jgi:hypothetical protein